MEKPEPLFPGVEWVLEASADEYGNEYSAKVGRNYALLAIQRNGDVDMEYPVAEGERGKIPEHAADTLTEALNWLRSRIIAHRDELCRVTGGRFKYLG